jgi:transcriptional regulator with XRE-family HTH domain
LKLIRQHLDLTQLRLGQQIGLAGRRAQSAISRWERGDGQPDPVSLLKIARLAGLKSDVLIDDAFRLTLEQGRLRAVKK